MTEIERMAHEGSINRLAKNKFDTEFLTAKIKVLEAKKKDKEDIRDCREQDIYREENFLKKVKETKRDIKDKRNNFLLVLTQYGLIVNGIIIIIAALLSKLDPGIITPSLFVASNIFGVFIPSVRAYKDYKKSKDYLERYDEDEITSELSRLKSDKKELELSILEINSKIDSLLHDIEDLKERKKDTILNLCKLFPKYRVEEILEEAKKELEKMKLEYKKAMILKMQESNIPIIDKPKKLIKKQENNNI